MYDPLCLKKMVNYVRFSKPTTRGLIMLDPLFSFALLEISNMVN